MDSKERNTDPYFSQDEERDLLRRAQQGDASARDRLVLGALPFVHKQICHRYLDLDDQDIEDLTQEAVPVLCSCIDLYNLDHPARARLYVFARVRLHSSASRFLRHHKLLSYSSELPEQIATDDPESDAVSEQVKTIVRIALATMSIRDQDLLVSRLALDKATSRAAIADRYNCPTHIIEYAEKRAVKRLRAALKGLTACASPSK